MKPQMAREAGFILRAGKDVIGSKVFNLDGEDIGKIEELVIDPRTARASYAILSFGGFLGMGDKLFAVPWVSMAYDPAGNRFVIYANKKLLENAPGFSNSDWPDLSDPLCAGQLFSFYGASETDTPRIYRQQGPLSPDETARRGPEAPGRPLLDDWGKGDKH